MFTLIHLDSEDILQNYSIINQTNIKINFIFTIHYKTTLMIFFVFKIKFKNPF